MDGLAEENLLSLAEESRFALEPTLGTLNPKPQTHPSTGSIPEIRNSKPNKEQDRLPTPIDGC